ncbi:hypothetical protein MPUL_24850 [Mycolicibacterium pulveris]|uniref:Uncharacterized protein n=1 Tax=Mycolicibacterium pulveris TaxID=36813 RepID=A0A7I7UJB4_MYCPV|nr:hypothetical protein MPUL_24850 [Mycolicibacterium pulveris]
MYPTIPRTDTEHKGSGDFCGVGRLPLCRRQVQRVDFFTRVVLKGRRAALTQKSAPEWAGVRLQARQDVHRSTATVTTGPSNAIRWY